MSSFANAVAMECRKEGEGMGDKMDKKGMREKGKDGRGALMWQGALAFGGSFI